MRVKLFLIIIACIAAHQATFARSNAQVTQNPTSTAPATPKKTTAAENAELREAQRLNQEVINLYNREKYDEALPLAFKSVEITERIVGSQDHELAVALRNLAELYVAKRKYKLATPLFLRAIAIDDLAREWSKDPATGLSTVQRYICFLYETQPFAEAAKVERDFDEKRRKQRPENSVAELKEGSLSGGVLNGRALSLPVPEFPDQAKRLKVAGVARIQVLIDETGRVIETKVLCGHPVFTRPALEAAAKARFTPTKLSGMPVKVNGIIIYNFGQ